MLAGCLRSAGVEAEVISIECVSIAEADLLIGKADIVGFGYPIYGSDIPLPMKRFLAELSPAPGKAAVVFCTQWLWSGDGARVAVEFVGSKGFAIRWAEHLHMPNNLSIPFPFRIHSDKQHSKDKYLRHSEGRLRRLASRVASNTVFRRGFGPLSVLSGLMQRKPYRAMMEKTGDSISVDHHRCTMCGLCVELCPVKNLGVRETAVWAGDKCVNCMRCYNFCPVSAIMFRGRTHKHAHGRPYRGPTPEFNPVDLTGRVVKED
jgi:NAD-dependent dihydropyrimidine dehydrogenase PreA subunit